MAIAPVQPLLRAPCLGDGRRRLPVTSTGQRVPYRRSMTIVPGGLDEDAPGVGVPGLGQRGPALPLTRGESALPYADVHRSVYYVHRQGSREEQMMAIVLRHKHVQLDQRKLDRARRALGARTETETLDRALDLVVTEADIDQALRAARGKGKLRRVF